MRGPSRTGDKVVLRIFEFLKAFVLFVFAIGALRTTHLPLAATPSDAIRAVFSAPTLAVQKITGLKENFSTSDCPRSAPLRQRAVFARRSADARGLRQSKDYVALSPLSRFRRRTLDTRKERPTRKQACPICERNRLPRLHSRRTSARHPGTLPTETRFARCSSKERAGPVSDL
jgi:hypothetical protein